jgi:hypothetical protein
MCAQLFWFKRNILEDLKTHGYLEQNLLPAMAVHCHLEATLADRRSSHYAGGV